MNRASKRGFTLIELMVVIAIIAVLLAILVPVVSRVRKAAQGTNTQQLMARIQGAITAYQTDYGAFPGYIPSNSLKPTGAPGLPISGLTLSGGNTVTSTEDLTLALMGGLRYQGGSIVYMADDVGKGPMNFNPLNITRKAGYINAAQGEISTGYLRNDANNAYANDTDAPEFMDAYPDSRPILYVRTNTANMQALLGVYHRAGPSQSDAISRTDADSAEFFTACRAAGGANGYVLVSAGPDRWFGKDRLNAAKPARPETDDFIVGGGK